jgi:ABC-type multidrug transport system, ATPase and permease components
MPERKKTVDDSLVRRLAASIREYRKNTVLAPLLVTLEVVMDVVIPYLMAKIIDRGIADSDMGMIWKIGVALVLCAVLSLTFGVLSGRHAAVASAGFAKNLRHDMYDNIQGFSFANIDKFSTASLVTRLTTDITNVQNAFQMLIRILVRSPLMLVFSLIMAFKVNAVLSLVFLAVVPVLGVGLYLIVTRAFPIFQQVIKVYDRLNTVVRENLRGIRVVKAFVREDFETKKFGEVSDSMYDGYVKAEKILALNSPLMQFSIYSCTLLLSWIGARMIVAESMTTGQLMGLISYASQILQSLMMLSMVLVMMTVSRASAKRIVEVLDEESTMPPAAKAVTTVADGSVEFRDVAFGYGGSQHAMCLRDVNIRIEPGMTVGIIGGTGSGKSTLVQLIPRLYEATSGSVAVGGVDVRQYDLEALRMQVAMVLQKNSLFSGSVKDNLRWGKKDATEDEMRAACRLAQADDFVSALPEGYDARVEQGGANFSGGQRQRLCIARALLKNPKILILDDSTSAVDAKTDEKIREAFKNDLPGMTKIIISQRIASIIDSDMIIVIDGGKINASGDHASLLRDNAIYREVYESQYKAPEQNKAGE